MRKPITAIVVALFLAVLFVPNVGFAEPNDNACWGQATKVFAQTGIMGEHASEQPTPRLGLANLAVALFDAGVIEEPTMQALGAFVSSSLGLSIEACM
jgi:hypothetical protein